MRSEQMVRETYSRIGHALNERAKRLWAASEALTIGYGGVSIVHRATGLSRQTIHAGIEEIQKGTSLDSFECVRKKGGGRNKIEEVDESIIKSLQELIKDHTRGDPMQPLYWTSKSTENLASELRKQGYTISDRTVSRLLYELDYSLQSNRKSLEGKSSTERDSQFIYINDMVKEYQKNQQPVISVDAKKKELIGDFKNNGIEWRQKGDPIKVKVHDFPDEKKQTKAIPYGIYDVTWNTGWVNVGVDHDTAEFAVESIRNWWINMGKSTYLNATKLLINADGGGSNSSRGRLWKVELQELADEMQLEITVCHLPPGTSKWNKIEHRLFCHITRNWRARPLTSYEVIVNLIANTTTTTGLKVRSELDDGSYELSIKVSDEEMQTIKMRKHEVNSKWNYTISPR